MGFGLPAAIGVKYAFPDKQVVDIAGDGSIQMNIQELATAAQYKINVKIVLLNNGYLGMVRQWQELFYEKRYSHTDMTYAPDFVKLAEAFGVVGLRATKPEEVESVLNRRPGGDARSVRGGISVFRRDGRTRHEPFVRRLLDQRVEEKLRRAFHRGINLFQLRRVAGEKIMVPQILAQPRAAPGPHAPIRAVNRPGRAPEVGVVMRHPAARAVLHLSRARAGLGHFQNHLRERFDAFAEVAGLGGPVIHLGVDVDGVFAVPRRRHGIVPQTLQRRGLAAGARTADQQVARELKIQRGELRIVAVGKMRDAHIRRQLHRAGFAEVERDAME